MGFRVTSSRTRFREYLAQFRNRIRSGEIKSEGGGGHHGTRPVSTSRSHRSFFQLFRELLRLTGGQRSTLVFALSTLTIATLLKLVPPFATKLAVDSILGAKPLPSTLTRWLPAGWSSWDQLCALVSAVIALSLIQTAIHVWGRWAATRASKQVQSAVRRHVFEQAVRLPLQRVYQLKAGGVASILREDAGSVGELIFSLIYNPWRAIIQLLGSFVILAMIDWKLLIGSLILLPLIYLSHRTYVGRLRPMFKDIRKQREEIDAHATEAFGGMRVVRAFGRQRSESARFVRGNHLMSRQELLAWWWSRGIELLWEIALPMISAALLLYGGWAVINKHLTLGDLTMFLFYLALLLGPLEVLANSATSFQTSLAALDRVLDLLEEPRELPQDRPTVKIERGNVRGNFELRDVSFTYPGHAQPVLQHVNMHVAAGETIAFVGPSGAGKTTLCNLIARFFDPTAGQILLDGQDLREIDIESYRKLLGVVEQDVFLFDGTVAENIGYGIGDATDAQIQRAAELAHAAEFIMQLEQTYDTRIGERGVRLSGGQKQRIAIARAILADPRILILDEATSNLDSESEALIQASLGALMSERTCFVIAHRLSTIRHADRIVVLEGGRLIESGSHAELMERSGRYKEMVEQQFGKSQLV
ncbi:MAG: ABC transporter ATP-binding protein [Planctomycetales bacterium]